MRLHADAAATSGSKLDELVLESLRSADSALLAMPGNCSMVWGTAADAPAEFERTRATWVAVYIFVFVPLCLWWQLPPELPVSFC